MNTDVKNKQYVPTDEELKGMGAQVEYEISEFRSSVREFAFLKTLAHADISAKNRALESALLHFRILRAFFFAEVAGDKDNDNVFARHYCAPAHWEPKKDPVFEATKKALNKRLAHLTLKRLTAKSWDELDSMIQAIEANVEHFVKSLPPARAQWFPSLPQSASIITVGDASNNTLSAVVTGGISTGPKFD